MACSWGPSPSHVAGPEFEPRAWRARCVHFFLHPPFLLWEIVFFAPSPPNLRKCWGYLYTTGWGYYNPNTIKSYKNSLQNTQHVVLHNRPTLSIGTERLACRAARDPRLARSRSRVRAPGPAGALRTLFFSTLPSSFSIKPAKVLGLKHEWTHCSETVRRWFYLSRKGVALFTRPYLKVYQYWHFIFSDPVIKNLKVCHRWFKFEKCFMSISCVILWSHSLVVCTLLTHKKVAIVIV